MPSYLSPKLTMVICYITMSETMVSLAEAQFPIASGQLRRCFVIIMLVLVIVQCRFESGPNLFCSTQLSISGILLILFWCICMAWYVFMCISLGVYMCQCMCTFMFLCASLNENAQLYTCMAVRGPCQCHFFQVFSMLF